MKQLMRDFCRFATGHVLSGDIDPMYPTLRLFYEREEVPREIAVWRTLVYVAFYHIGSAEKFWTRYPEPGVVGFDLRGLPTGIERRGFRANTKPFEHINVVLEYARARAGGLLAWVDAMTSLGGEKGWDQVRAEFQSLPGGGPWSSYKIADLLKHVHGAPITASDIGVGGKGETAGPIPGMVQLTGEDWKECAANVGLQRRLLDQALENDVPFTGLDQLETSLCDFNSLTRGRYYVGHDIDSQMDHLRDSSSALKAAREVFPARYRGELGGWVGVRKELKSVYASKGELVVL